MKKFPLLEAQNGIVLSWMQNPTLTQHNVCFSHRLDKSIDIQRLRDAMLSIVSRHDIFRTRIEHHEDGFYQYIDLNIRFNVKVSSMSDAEYGCYKRSFLRPFNLLDDVLVRLEIVETESTVYALADMHHCIADGYTINRFWDEVDDVYQGHSVAIEDHLLLAVEREKSSFLSPEYSAARQYYTNTFADLDITHIPTKNPEAIGTLRSINTFVSKELVDAFCQQHGLSPNMLFMTANAMALSAFSGDKKIVFDALYHGRSDNDTSSTLGMFIKNIPVLFDFDRYQNYSFPEVASDVSTQFHISHKGIYPYTHFAKDLGISSNNTFTFQSWFSPVTINGIVRQSEHLQDGGNAEFTSVLVYPYADNYKIIVEYNDARYSEWLIRQYVECIADVSLNIIRHPETTISHIAILSPEKQTDMLLQGIGETITDVPDVIAAFRRQAHQAPDSVAVVDEAGYITYAQLDEASNRLASSLYNNGISPLDVVAMLMPRTKEYIISILATLKIRATFVPIDTEYPQSRIDYILARSKAKLLLTQERVVGLLSAPTISCHFPDSMPLSSDIVYMIFTSGSTGNPKGVMISRRALNSFVSTCVHTYQLTAADRIFCHSSFSFDASIEDIFPILTCGGQLHIPNASLRKDVDAIRQYIIDHNITGGNYTTAFGTLLLASCPALPLRYVTVGGERLDKIPSGLTCRFFNSYGPTEFTVDSTFWEMPTGFDGHVIPIGRPVCNCRAYILDTHQRLLPNGCPGELFLAGPQLATGYCDSPELTAEKFLPNPFADGNDKCRTFYRTGDIVRWNEDKQIEFIGRNDSQVKLRGFRIELGEVETLLSCQPDIVNVIAKVVQLHTRDTLCIWYTTHSGHEINDIRTLAAKTLPEFMVPDVFVHLETFPLTENGKINHKKLIVPDVVASARPYVSPFGNSERILTEIVSSITGISKVSVTDDLFREIGLSSLQAIKLAFTAKSKGVDINVTTLYERRTIRAIFQHSGKRNAHYWADGEYDPSKPVAILVCGYVYVHPLYDNLISYFKRMYSIYIMDAFHENFMWKEQVSCDILIDEYMEAFQREVMGKPIKLIMGTCYGADIAIPFANRIKKDTGVAYPVLAMDPVYSRKDVKEIIPYEKNPDEAILEEYRISGLLGKTIPTPTYDGPMIIVGPSDMSNRKYPEYDDVFLSKKEEQEYIHFMQKNDEDWKIHFPHVPHYKIPGDHYRFLETPNLPRLEEIITTHWPDEK